MSTSLKDLTGSLEKLETTATKTVADEIKTPVPTLTDQLAKVEADNKGCEMPKPDMLI